MTVSDLTSFQKWKGYFALKRKGYLRESAVHVLISDEGKALTWEVVDEIAFLEARRRDQVAVASKRNVVRASGEIKFNAMSSTPVSSMKVVM